MIGVSQDLSRRPNRAGSGGTLSLPAPVGGWNARDGLDTMPETDAVTLVNWFPDADRLTVRPGFVDYANGIGSASVEALIEWAGAVGRKLVAAGGGEIYDVSSPGSGSVLTAAAFGSDRWQGANFGGRLLMVNGADAPQSYDGVTISAAGFTGSGLTPSDLNTIQPFKGRLYFSEQGSAKFWYGGVGAITGPLTSFDLASIAQSGGSLKAIGTWSRDGGNGLDDLIVFVMSTGEIIVYQGIDPAVDFTKVGSYAAPAPIGVRCLAKIGGELVVLTKGGYFPVSLIMAGGMADVVDRHPVWGKIRPAARDASATFGDGLGWQAFNCPTGCAMYINLPIIEGQVYEQHVLNTITGAWTKYTGIPAIIWASHNDEIYFGGPGGKVFKLGGVSDIGQPIPFVAKQAFNYLGNRSATKRFTAVKPVISIDGVLDASVAVDTDFGHRSLPSNVSRFKASTSGASWDQSDWDLGDWAGGTTAVGTWLSVAGIGRTFALRFEGGANAQSVNWYSTDVLAQRGGVR